MDIRELKKYIEYKSLPSMMLVLKYSDNKFLCYQYVDAIIKFKNKEKIFIASVEDILNKNLNSSFEDNNDYIYILDIEELTQVLDVPNLIVICKKINKEVNVDFVNMPSLVPWQIEDYAALKLPGLTNEDILWLVSNSKNDIYRVDNECKKLSLFNKANQKEMFELIKLEDGYDDLSNLTIFSFTNAFIKKDIIMLNKVINRIDAIGIEAFSVIALLTKQFKNLIDIQLNPKATPEDLGLKLNQFNAIKYNCNKYSNKQLVAIYEFLTSLDSKVKLGEMPLTESNTNFIVYLTSKILAF